MKARQSTQTIADDAAWSGRQAAIAPPVSGIARCRLQSADRMFLMSFPQGPRMRYTIPALLVALVVGRSTPVPAQLAEWVNQLLTAAQLPVVTAEARREGITSDDIRAVLDAMRRAGVPAHEATALIDTERVARREHGPVDNFGAFVQSQLAAGKRGQDLAAAIRTEHARRGKGNAARGGRGRGQDKADTGRGRGGDAQPPGARGAPDRKQDDRGRRRPPNG